eukprot:CAMPEP_0115711272 /NCGR_PEP_ID=MMETSP0272-20121206/73474_1 /TAXON_ID=71861 /ORGANISM="Scrippsiella trochoidea, Strain CCMP3099" /LENGTH=194 /DNA_ID=CAMNT_0003153053 /DNA_START=48 /DNA_END=630 /DNA_ORIENTATION=-
MTGQALVAEPLLQKAETERRRGRCRLSAEAVLICLLCAGKFVCALGKIVYIVAVVFAMFRIITALFLKDTLAVAANDAESAIQTKMRQAKKFANELLSFFRAADKSKDGVLTLEEFENTLQDPRVKTWLSLMDVEILDPAEFFALLADEQGRVDAEHFIRTIVRCKGPSRAQDTMAITYMVNRILYQVEALEQQ